MKNYTKGKRTMIGEIPEGIEFKKCADYVGSYDEGDLIIMGYLKTRSELYNKDQYSLLISDQRGKKDTMFFLNVPAWYGAELEQDFLNSGEDAETFFAASIEAIESFETKYKKDSYNIMIYSN